MQKSGILQLTVFLFFFGGGGGASVSIYLQNYRIVHVLTILESNWVKVPEFLKLDLYTKRHRMENFWPESN